MTSIPLIQTQEHACSYLEGRLAQSLLVHPVYQLTTEVYAQLLAQGFRRNGDEVYATSCPRCSACIPARVPLARFRPDRSQKRCWKKNRNTRVIVKPAVFEQAHYDMYMRYQHYKHKGGGMSLSSPQDYIGFLGSSWCETRFAEFSIDGRLSAVAVIDQFDRAWSAVYTFFEPEFFEYSPGVYAVLWQIDQAYKQHREYLYLGYWIKNCKKMSYKYQYQPLQLYMGGHWVDSSATANYFVSS